MAESQNVPFSIFKEIRVEEHEGDVRFQTASRYIAHAQWIICNITFIIGTGWSLWTCLWGRYHV